MVAGTVPADRPGSPGSLIVSFTGSFLREIGGWIAVSDLIRLLGQVGVADTAVRQALVRLKGRGFLVGERRSGVAGYAVSAAAMDDLRTGDRRIFRYGEATADDGWVLAVFSVPESLRQHRHQLRSQLGRLGFGTVSPGVWIAPGALVDPARQELRESGLDEYVRWFTGQPVGPVDAAAWWDLPSLAAMYTDFLGEFGPRVPGTAADVVSGPDGETGSAAAFVGYLPLLDVWRQFPRLDPGLPPSLLPTHWPGRAAWELFALAHARWHGAALEYVRQAVR